MLAHPQAISAQTTSPQSFSSKEGHVEFHSKVPLHNFVGRSEQLNGSINLESGIVDFYVDLETLKTGNGKRDKDMRTTLETVEFPFAEFYGTLQTDFDTDLEGPQEVRVAGTFTVHGIENDLVVEGTMEFVEGDLVLKATWIINLDDYQIVPPRLLFFKVDDEQDVRINTRLKPNL